MQYDRMLVLKPMIKLPKLPSHAMPGILPDLSSSNSTSKYVWKIFFGCFFLTILPISDSNGFHLVKWMRFNSELVPPETTRINILK